MLTIQPARGVSAAKPRDLRQGDAAMPVNASSEPDRQVDLARDDEVHHAARHDRGDAGLDRQVVEVARREEDAVGQRREHDPDDDSAAIIDDSEDRGASAQADPTASSLLRGAQPGYAHGNTRRPGRAKRAVRDSTAHAPRPWEPAGRPDSRRLPTCRPAGALAASTPAQTCAFVTQPASITALRLSLVIGIGASRIASCGMCSCCRP